MKTRARNWILRPYLFSARWIEEESTILVIDTFCMLTSVIDQKWTSWITNYSFVNDRIITVRLKTNRGHITIIGVYVPEEGREEEKRRFYKQLQSITGYTRLDKIGSEDIKCELEISGIQDVRLKYKQNWINHLERMDNTRLTKYALTYKPRGRRDRGRPKKRWQRVDAGTGQTI